MAGAELALLDRPREVVVLADAGADLVATMPDHDAEARWREQARGGDDVGQKGTAGERVHDLREVGVHALALAGGQDDDLQRYGCGHRGKKKGQGRETLPGCVAPLTKEFLHPP